MDDARRAYLKAWRAANPEKVRAYRRKSRSRPEARASERSQTLKRRYGITSDDYDRMVSAQDGRCAICGDEADLVVDHDHDTGCLRDLLCVNCNRSLGGFQESEEVLRRAIAYIRRHRALSQFFCA